MKIRLVADEFFDWGVYGGFGAFTRKLAVELVKKGVEVDVIVQHISDSQLPPGETEVIDGVPIKTLYRKKLGKLRSKKLYQTDADVIHSQCGMFDTYLAFKHNKDSKKIVTVQDLRTKQETKMLSPLEKTSGYPWYKRLWAMYVRSCYAKAMRNADVVACQAYLLFPKVKEVYGVEPSVLLPNFIDVPSNNFRKAGKPSVVWLARLDPIKQPELCFEVAKKTPRVDFYILGAAHDKIRDKHLRRKYEDVENLHLLGFQSGEMKQKVLSEAWILINTSRYECLPVSFLEALAHKCAILSTQNPENYTNNFGVHTEPNVKALASGLSLLLTNDSWRELGEKGYDYVKQVHSTEKGIDAHIKLYNELLK